MGGFPQKCKHGKIEYTCIECNGKGICIHKRNRAYCKECKGSQLCSEHLKDKRTCIKCHKKAVKADEDKTYVTPVVRGGAHLRKMNK